MSSAETGLMVECPLCGVLDYVRLDITEVSIDWTVMAPRRLRLEAIVGEIPAGLFQPHQCPEDEA